MYLKFIKMVMTTFNKNYLVCVVALCESIKNCYLKHININTCEISENFKKYVMLDFMDYLRKFNIDFFIWLDEVEKIKAGEYDE